jgi:transposase
MFIREAASQRKYGPPVKYLQLVESKWDPVTKKTGTEILCKFGRIDRLKEQEIRSIAYKLLSYLQEEPLDAPQGVAVGQAKEFGLLYLLENLWKKLKIDRFFRQQLKNHKYEMPVERAILSMIFNRCQEPKSKLSTYEWLQEETFFSTQTQLQLQHLYRALDFLQAHHDELEEALYFRLCNLYNREVDLIFFDTTSTYFELRDPDEDDLRQYGYPHSHRKDRPQILIGLAVNAEGLPLASEVFPGNTADVSTVKRMIKRTKKMGLGRCIFVSDRGTVSEENLQALKAAGLDYIVGVKLRSTKQVREQVLPLAFGWEEVRENLKVKEVEVEQNRYVLCFNEKEARKDRQSRDKWIARIESLLPAVNTGRTESSEITNHIVMKRLVKKNKSGHLVLNEEKIRQEERCDGLYIVRSSKSDLPAKEVALSYKTLQQVERAFHYIKSFVEIRPCCHFSEYRIKGHVLLCVLAYLLQRWVELKTDYSWLKIRTAFKKIHAVELTVNKEKFIHRSGLNHESTDILRKLKVKYPPKILWSKP